MSKSSPKPASTPASHHTEGHSPAKGVLDDDVLHVPRGIPRWQFVFLITLMIFLLVVWLVPGSFQDIFRDTSNQNPVVVRWERPGQGTVEWLGTDLTHAERGMRLAFSADQFLAYGLGVNPSSVKLEDVVRISVLDQLAQDAGLEVTDTDLAIHIREMLGFLQQTEDDFKNLVRNLGADQISVEESIRRLLRVSRFQQIVGYAGGVPDPQQIEELWHQENVEFAFDFVALSIESLKAEARTALPSDAELQAWFEKLPEGEREEFKTPEKRMADFALFRGFEAGEDNEPPALVTAYPEKPAEGVAPTAPEELAHQYYNRTAAQRFQEPRAEGEDATTEPAGIRPFEEVQALCQAEAPVYFAMQRWLDDLKARKASAGTIDFRTEADTLGLDFESTLEPQSEEQFRAPGSGVSGSAAAEAVFGALADGSFYYSVATGPWGFMVVRVNQRTEPAQQPFDVIRERVAEKWLGPKSRELAEARLDSLRTGFEAIAAATPEGEEPQTSAPRYRATGEVFRAALQAAGLEVQTREWLNKAGPANKDPLWEQEAHKTLFGQANQFRLYQLESDEVAAPGLSSDEKTVYLVRRAGQRPVPLENMSPAQYKRYKQTARGMASNEIARGMDLDYLRKNFGLWLRQDGAQEPAKPAPTDADENG